MVRNRVFVLCILAVLAIFIPSAVLPASAASKSAAPYQVTAELTAWRITGTTGVAGVTLSYVDNVSKSVISDSGGIYNILIPDGWTGTITPSLEGYTFDPPSISYASPVTADTPDQDYTATFVATSTPTVTVTRTRTATAGATFTKTLTPPRTATPTTPSGFTKIYPWNGAAKIGLTSITFSWKTYSPAPQKYRYCLDTSNNNNCDAGGGYTSISGTSVTLSNLIANKTYYWHVQAVTCLTCVPKTVVDTNSGAWWSFTTGSVPTATRTRTPTKVASRTPTRTPVPTTVTLISVGSYDGSILESSENSGVGGTMSAASATFSLGDDASNRQLRAILSFNTAGLPDTAVIKSAVLKISQSGAPIGTNPFSVLGGLRVDIRQGVFGSAANLALEDFNASASAVQVGVFGTTPAGTWYSATLNALGRSKFNLMGATQLRLYFALDDDNNTAADNMKFVSGNGASGKPQLIITYIVP